MHGTGISRLGHVRVDLSGLVALPGREQPGDVRVSGLDALLKVCARVLGVRALKVVVAEAGNAEGDVLELGPEQVVLVEEEDHRRLGEPRRVDNLVKELDGLIDTVGLGILVEYLVVFGNGGDENNRSNVIKSVNPFLTLVTLASDICRLDRKLVLNAYTCAQCRKQSNVPNMTNGTPSITYFSSTIPEVRTRAWSTSCWVGTYPAAEIRSISVA